MRVIGVGTGCCLFAMLFAAVSGVHAEPHHHHEKEKTPAKAKPKPHFHDHKHSKEGATHDRVHRNRPAKRAKQHTHNQRGHSGRSGGEGVHSGHTHGIETENLFGFTAGSDTENAGAVGLALENVGRFGKRDGRYAGVGQKVELSYGVTDDLSVALALFADYHRITGVTGLTDARTFDFNGIGGEMRWRLVRRGPAPFGVTLHIEPSRQRYDELTGQRATKYGAENKLIFDTELVPDRIFAAFNLLYEVERVREHGQPGWEEGSKIGFAAAASAQVAPQIFVGGEFRYLRAYEGLLPKTFAGDAVFVGPTLFWHFAGNAWIAAAWNVQVAGHAVGQPGALDLVNFERHQVRVKLGLEFEPANGARRHMHRH